MQRPLSLGENRAVAAVLCNLAFNTYYRKPSELAKRTDQTQKWISVLDQYFPVLLRRLYERDNRRQFCPVELWLAPFSTTISPGEAAQISPAVLQAVLNRTSRSRPHIYSLAIFSLGATEEAISSSTAYVMGLVNLLLTAPQCIPFNKRVEIFRDLIKSDKVRLGLHLPIEHGGHFPAKVPPSIPHLSMSLSR